MLTKSDSYVMERIAEAKESSKKFHGRIRMRRNMYKMGLRPKPGKEFVYNDPAAVNAVDVAVGILAANRVDFSAQGFVSTHQEEKYTSRVERFLLGILHEADQQTGMDLQYENILATVRDGVSVTYAVWDRVKQDSSTTVEQIPKLGEDGALMDVEVIKGSPFYVEHVDAESMYFIPGSKHGRWEAVVRKVTMTYWEAYQKYGILPESMTHGADERTLKNQKGEFVDYWEILQQPEEDLIKDLENEGIVETDVDIFLRMRQDEVLIPIRAHTVVRNAVMFDNIPIKPLQVMPGYNHIPYHFAFYKPVLAGDSEYWTTSIIDPMIASIYAIKRAVERRDRQISVFSELHLILKSAKAGKKWNLDPGMGKALELDPGDEAGFIRWNGSPPDVEEHLGFLSRRLQQSSFNDALFLGNMGSSGYALAQISDTNRIRLLQPKRHLERFYTSLANGILDLTSEFADGKVISVYGEHKGSLFADEFNGKYAKKFLVKATVTPVFPAERQRNHGMAMQAAQFLSRRTVLERYLEVDDVEREEQRKMVEQFKDSEVTRTYTMRKFMRQMADGGDIDAKIVLSQMDSGQLNVEGNKGQPPPADPINTPGLLSSNGRPPSEVPGGAQ